MEKNPRDMTISEAMKHYGLPDHWEASEVAAWVMANETNEPMHEVRREAARIMDSYRDLDPAQRPLLRPRLTALLRARGLA